MVTYSKLCQVLNNVPEKYHWYVDDYLKKSVYDSYETYSSCPDCSFKTSTKEKNGTCTSTFSKGNPTNTVTISKEKPHSSTDSTEMNSMVKDFVDMMSMNYGFCRMDMEIKSVDDRIFSSIEYYDSLRNEFDGDCVKHVAMLTETHTINFFSSHINLRESVHHGAPRLTDIIYMGDDKLLKAMTLFMAIANKDRLIHETVEALSIDRDVTIYAIFFSELLHCMSCQDKLTNPKLNGPRLLFNRLEKHGYRDTLNWAIKQVEDFSLMVEKLSKKLYIFENLKKSSKSELKAIIQIILKFHSNYKNCSQIESDKLLSVNPLFVPIFAILQFKRELASGK